MAVTLRELTDYYTALLAYQFRGLPNATRQMQLYTKQFVADNLATSLFTCYDIDLAVGPQLDTIGKYVGVARNIGVVIVRPYFSLWTYGSTLDPADYQGTWEPAGDTPTLPAASGVPGHWYVVSASGESATPIAETWRAGDVIFSDGSVWAKNTTDNGNGLTTYADTASNAEGVFYTYAFFSGQNSDLSDAEYRVVLKLKIVLNASNGTLASIMDYLVEFFPDGQITLTDNKDMTLSYYVLSTVALSKELLEIYLPRPMGVGITVTIVNPTPGGGEELTTEDGITLTTEDGTPLTTEPT